MPIFPVEIHCGEATKQYFDPTEVMQSMTSESKEVFIAQCEKLAQRAKYLPITSKVDWLKGALAIQHTPTIAIVGFDANATEPIRMAEEFCEVVIPEEAKEAIDKAYLTLSHTPNIEGEQKEDSNQFTLMLPCDALTNRRFLLCPRRTDDWLALSAEADALCLVVNATMVMTQTERDWIKSCVGRWFRGVHLAVFIKHLDKLHSEEEISEVRSIVSDTLQRNGVQAQTFGDSDEALQCLDASLAESNAVEQREERIIRNTVTALQEEIHILCEEFVTNATSIR